MRKFLVIFGAVAVFALVPLQARGQVFLGPTVAWHDDLDFGVGATVGFDLPSISPGVAFMGDVFIFFPDNADYFEFNANMTYDFPLEGSSVLPFALAGLNLGRISYDSGDFDPGFDVDSGSNTEVGLNLGGGASFDVGRFRPKVGGRFILIDNGPDFVFFVTLPFRLSS
jgi:hypothetical protein